MNTVAKNQVVGVESHSGGVQAHKHPLEGYEEAHEQFEEDGDLCCRWLLTVERGIEVVIFSKHLEVPNDTDEGRQVVWKIREQAARVTKNSKVILQSITQFSM